MSEGTDRFHSSRLPTLQRGVYVSRGSGERGFAVLPSVDERSETGFGSDYLIVLPTEDDESVQLQLFDPVGVGYLDDEFRGCYFLG